MKTFQLKAFWERKPFTTLGWVKKWQTKNKSLLQNTLYDSDAEIVARR
jgi:hypothetical protein